MAVDKCSLENIKAVKSCYYLHEQLIPQKVSLNRIPTTNVDYLVRCFSVYKTDCIAPRLDLNLRPHERGASTSPLCYTAYEKVRSSATDSQQHNFECVTSAVVRNPPGLLTYET